MAVLLMGVNLPHGSCEQVTMINKRRIGGNDAPLIYHIDPSVPEEWRQYMKQGVENWQPAFEAAGLGDKAIRAVLPGDEDWPQDYNAGDIRCALLFHGLLGLFVLSR